jgi:hypothetical protein
MVDQGIQGVQGSAASDPAWVQLGQAQVLLGSFDGTVRYKAEVIQRPTWVYEFQAMLQIHKFSGMFPALRANGLPSQTSLPKRVRETQNEVNITLFGGYLNASKQMVVVASE